MAPENKEKGGTGEALGQAGTKVKEGIVGSLKGMQEIETEDYAPRSGSLGDRRQNRVREEVPRITSRVLTEKRCASCPPLGRLLKSLPMVKALHTAVAGRARFRVAGLRRSVPLQRFLGIQADSS